MTNLSLRAELAFQDSQRTQGVFRPDTPPIVPALGLAATGYALRSQPQRPADHPALSSSTGDISTLAKQGHFYFGLTDAADWQQRMDTSLMRCVHGYLDATRSKHLKSSVVAPGRTSCICRDWMSVYRAGRFSEVRLRLAVTRRRLLRCCSSLLISGLADFSSCLTVTTLQLHVRPVSPACRPAAARQRTSARKPTQQRCGNTSAPRSGASAHAGASETAALPRPAAQSARAC